VCAPEVGEIAEELAGNLNRQDGRQRVSEPRAMPVAPAIAATPVITRAATDDDEVRRVPSPRSPSRHGAEDEQLASETRAEQAAPRVSRLTSEPAAEPASDQARRKRKRRRRKQRRDIVETAGAQPAQPVQAQAAEPAAGQSSVESAAPAAQAADAAQGSGPAYKPSVARAATAVVTASVTASSGGRAGTAAEHSAHLGAVPVVSDGVPQPITGRVHAHSQSARAQTSGRVRASTVTARPVLIIDDEHPEDAERSQEERVERSDPSWRSFLPPALLDSDDGSHRGTLTLAVIILVIVATLTMSYLLRRPNVSGDGVTWRGPVPGQMSKTSSNTPASPRA
jgi:hypothetical protein